MHCLVDNFSMTMSFLPITHSTVFLDGIVVFTFEGSQVVILIGIRSHPDKIRLYGWNF